MLYLLVYDTKSLANILLLKKNQLYFNNFSWYFSYNFWKIWKKSKCTKNLEWEVLDDAD
jgi:hypothetical protein